MAENEAPAIETEPRTLIEDLAPSVEDLAADDAALAEGGALNLGTRLGGGLNCCDGYTTKEPNTSTAGKTIFGVAVPDQDYSTDHIP